MAFIKNQILKRLSGFTKNFSADKFQLSVLKGETVLTNLELNEDMLMATLGLPTWLRISKATCNSISIKISWTRLKTQPVVIHLDRVEVKMEVCDEPRDANRTSTLNIPTRPPNTEYGLVDRILDGITLEINTVSITLRSRAFASEIELSRLRCASCAPSWAPVNDLKYTQIRNSVTGEILVYKEVSWETTRFEAQAVFDARSDGKPSTSNLASVPLRLIANLARIRLVLKKRFADNSIVATRLQVLFNDLLWVLTLSQLEAAIVFGRHLLHVISMSQEQERRTRRDEPAPHAPAPRSASAAQPNRNNAASAVFERYDVGETSYHLYVKYVDLHLCEDGLPDRRLSANAVSGGGVRITLQRLAFDCYPDHKPVGSRKNWLGMNTDLAKRMRWHEKLLSQFWRDLARTNSGSQAARVPIRTNAQQEALREMCCLVRLKHVQIRTVSTPTTGSTPGPTYDLLVTDSSMHIPDDVFSIYLEYGEHYYIPSSAMQQNLPVPPPNLFAMVYPIRFTADQPTIVWLNAFATRLSTHLADLSERITLLEQKRTPTLTKPDSQMIQLRVELLLPSIVLPADAENDRPDQLHALQLGVSQALITNALVHCADESEREFLVDFDPLASVRGVRDDLRKNGSDTCQLELFEDASLQQLANSSSFWFIYTDHMWLEHFYWQGAQASKPQPFLNEFTLRISLLNDQTDGTKPRIGVAIDCARTKFVHFEVGYRQIIALQTVIMSIARLADVLLADRKEIIESAERANVDAKLGKLLAIPAATPPQVQLYLLVSPRCTFVITFVLRAPVAVTHCQSPAAPSQSDTATPHKTEASADSRVQFSIFELPQSSSSPVRAGSLASSHNSERPLVVKQPIAIEPEPPKLFAGLKKVGSVGSLSIATDDDDTCSVSFTEDDVGELLDLPSEAPSLFDDSPSVEVATAVRADTSAIHSSSATADVRSLCSDLERESVVSLVSLFVGAPRITVCSSPTAGKPRVELCLQCEPLILRELGDQSTLSTYNRDSAVRIVDSVLVQVLSERPAGSVHLSLLLADDVQRGEAQINALHVAVRSSCLDGLVRLFAADFGAPVAVGAVAMLIRITDLHVRVIPDEPDSSLSSLPTSLSSSSGISNIPINVKIANLMVELDADGAVRVNSHVVSSVATSLIDAPLSLEQTLIDFSDKVAPNEGPKDGQRNSTGASSFAMSGVANTATNDEKSDSAIEAQLIQTQYENIQLKVQVADLTDENQRLARESQQLILLVNELQDELNKVQKRAATTTSTPTSTR